MNWRTELSKRLEAEGRVLTYNEAMKIAGKMFHELGVAFVDLPQDSEVAEVLEAVNTSRK